uniref:hypothetical protein n=2 Tax=Roseivirga sp. TaxID=1964215 RepID=UPI00404784A6
MRIKTLLSVFIIFALCLSCKKKDAEKPRKVYSFNYRVKISNRINEPTVISGYYGHVMEYKGNFIPSPDAEPNQPKIAQNKILLFLAEHKEAIEAAAYQENGITFYNLRKLKKMDIEPKYTILPNKQGYYQFDLGDKEYYAILEIKKSKGYFNGGAMLVKGSVSSLVELEMRIDYQATF